MGKWLSPLFRIITVLLLAGLFLLLVIATPGCTDLRPSYVDGALVHESHPMAGPGPAPFGGPGDETTRDSLESTMGWERGYLMWEGTLGYTLRERNDVGGPWTARFRFGVRVQL